ncbi:MAG: mandelate racemase/muconate lactonizing enzyme family protein [Actinomycetota bacterium]|jgi:L-alanine-DL-glutamate epimerase-like enolase superfamily enzyme|nr:mandelate racemase/muconate lactonizing enzyme family protein [Actinomycetota bacterium]
MRITNIKATPVAVPFGEDELWAFGGRRGLVSILVEVETDEGVVGLGEAAAYPSADIVLAVLRSLEGLVVGEDPFHIERIMKKIEVVGTWHHVRATSPGIAAIEMACWDIVGKVCGQPLVNLFGGPVRERVPFFYYLSQRSPEDMSADAREAVEQGFGTLYLKAGSDDSAVDVARVEAVRDGAGPEAAIRVDANEAWSPGAAIRIVKEMEAFGLELVEQPVSARNLSEMAYVRGRINPPLLANEASWTRYDQLEVIRHSAADVVSVDNQMDGGLLNLKRSAGLCEIAGLPVLKHSLGELGVAVYAATHVMASSPNFLYANQSYASFLTDDTIKGTDTLPYEGGELAVPDAPGIGVELDRDKVGKYADLYHEKGHEFSFHDPSAVAATPLMPKL